MSGQPNDLERAATRNLNGRLRRGWAFIDCCDPINHFETMCLPPHGVASKLNWVCDQLEKARLPGMWKACLVDCPYGKAPKPGTRATKGGEWYLYLDQRYVAETGDVRFEDAEIVRAYRRLRGQFDEVWVYLGIELWMHWPVEDARACERRLAHLLRNELDAGVAGIMWDGLGNAAPTSEAWRIVELTRGLGLRVACEHMAGVRYPHLANIPSLTIIGWQDAAKFRDDVPPSDLNQRDPRKGNLSQYYMALSEVGGEVVVTDNSADQGPLDRGELKSLHMLARGWRYFGTSVMLHWERARLVGPAQWDRVLSEVEAVSR